MAFLRLAFQDPYDRNYCVPIPCRRWHTEQFVDLAKIADRFHMTTVDSEDESILRRDDSQEPLPVERKCGWNGRPDAAGLRQDAHESNDIRACRLSRKRTFHLQADKITGVAERNFRFERQLLAQFSAELCSRYPPSPSTGRCVAVPRGRVRGRVPRNETSIRPVPSPARNTPDHRKPGSAMIL
jgi:hypothetical protein